MDYKKQLANYYSLAKPSIIYGNLITALAGYLFASRWKIDYLTLVAMLVGLGLIIGCGCVINNLIDKDIDKMMSRTKKRALINGDITLKAAKIYALVLGLLGASILFIYTNTLTLEVALIGLIAYDVVYTYSKRKTVYGTLIGSISGAIPPVVGYVAVTSSLDAPAYILFLIIVCWQVAHFYAIGLYRLKDYKKARIPIWPVIEGLDSTKKQIFVYIGLFSLASISLWALGYCGMTYLAIVICISLYWLIPSYRQLDRLPPADWGRQVFIRSLTVMMLISVAIAIGPVAP